MAPLVPALISGGLALASGVQAADSNRKIARAQENAANAQLAAAREAQQLLSKRIDEAVSDSEAAQLRAEGLISSATEQRINEINQSTEGFVQNIQNLQMDVRTDEENILASLIESGTFTTQELENGVLDSIAQTAGFTDRAIAAFSPFVETGKRALKQIQFDTGQLTPEEAQQFRTEFGIKEGERPQSAVARAAEEAALRRLRASGISQSGFALDELAQTAATVEDADQRRNERLASQGLQASGSVAGLEAGRGQDILSVSARLQENIAQQRQNQAERERITREEAARKRLGLGEISANQELLAGSQVGQLLQQQNLDLANVATQGAANRGNLRVGGAETIGNIGVRGQQLASPNLIAAAESRGLAAGAPLQGLASGLNVLSSSGQFQSSPQNSPEFVGPRRPGL
ncbi:MAG TPA: hypothetical protein VMV86_05215 [Methanosarcinales archaeon]|nr:hypothetical protein [Methanosarcinales archaeon]